MTEQADNLDAVDRYMGGSTPHTSKAADLRRKWIDWFADLSWYSKNYDSDIEKEAFRRRDDYNLANAVTPQQRQNVEQVITRGYAERGTLGEVEYSAFKRFWISAGNWAKGGIIVGAIGAILYGVTKLSPVSLISKVIRR